MKRIKLLSKALAVLTVAMLFLQCVILPSGAVAYSGSGTAADPYLITTAEQLDGIRENLSAHYKLAATVDLSSVANFKPIGTIAKPFTGSLKCDLNTDGYPLYAILNLTVHTAKGEYIDEGMSKWEAALFGGAENASFENIYVLNAKISNDNYGDNRGAVVYGDYKPGMDEMNSAALIGQATNCTVTGCGSTGVIDTQSNHSAGLIGFMVGGAVSNSWSTATVTSLGKWQIAGFIGTVIDNAAISNCFATGNIEGTQSTIGAFIGDSTDSIVTNCYATGNARDGFISKIQNSTVANCYYTGTAVSGGTDSEILASTVTGSYYLTGKYLTHEGFLQGTEAEIKAAFAQISDWDTQGTLPTLKTTKIPEISGYAAGAVFGTPAVAQATPSVTDSPSNTTADSQSQAASSLEESKALMTTEELTELINSFPAAELITLDNKEDIKKAVAAYESLSETEKDNFDLIVYKKMVEAKKAVSYLMVADISTRIEALPEAEKIKKSDEKEVKAIYEDYSFLDEDYKSYINENLRAKLEDCVKALESVGESAASSSAFTTSEIVVLILLAAVIFLNAVTNIVITLILFKKKRQSQQTDGGLADEDE